MRIAAAGCAIALLVTAARFCHLDLLWIEEAYPLAAAAEILRGKVLYRDIWFDKPPLYALFYTLCGAAPGWTLRILSSVYVLLGCWAVWRLYPSEAKRGEAITASALLAIYLTFDIPSAVMALAPDLLSVPLHIAAVFLAMRGHAFASGAICGLALLVNTKALFVLAACLLWAPRAGLFAGAALPNLIAIGWLGYAGALVAYWEQVWIWGMRYSSDTFVADPWKEGLLRTANWSGFHAALVLGAAFSAWRERSWRTAVWIALAIAAVCAGGRFFPRYYFLLLPPMLFAGVRGLFAMPRLCCIVALCTLLIPIVRFGPRYATLALGDRAWSDLAMMQDSKQAAAIARGIARPGDRLLVWGYRPDVLVFSGLPAATRFLDSQPLNGVLADRHLFSTQPTAADLVATNVLELQNGPSPEIIVDGLGPLNPGLAADRFTPLRTHNYVVAGRTRMSIVYVAKR